MALAVIKILEIFVLIVSSEDYKEYAMVKMNLNA